MRAEIAIACRKMATAVAELRTLAAKNTGLPIAVYDYLTVAVEQLDFAARSCEKPEAIK